MTTARISRRTHLGMNICFLATLLTAAGAKAQQSDRGSFMSDLGPLENSLVRISGEGAIGIGFVGAVGGKQYIFTNASVISGHNVLKFQNLKGKPLQPRKIELSATRDLVRLLVVGEEALTLSSELTENGPIAVLEYNQGNIKAHSGVITGSSTDMIEVNASFEKECSGSPLIDSTKAVRGMANHLVYFKDQDGRWAGTPRSFAYKLNGAAWYSANWKQNNKTYGKSLREVDEFRTIVYTIAARWAKTPKAEVEYKESAGLDFDRWVKAHNDFVSDLSKKKSKGASDASEKMQKRYQESCNSLIRICEAKAKNLEFLCEDKKITKYLRIQFKWRSLELKKFCRFVTATAKQHERDRWM